MYVHQRKDQRTCALYLFAPPPLPQKLCVREELLHLASRSPHIILSLIADEDTQTEVSKYPAKNSSLYVCCNYK
jgi:hypothetical protein